MANRRISMRKIREVLRLKYQIGISNRQIAESCVIAHGTVDSIIKRAKVLNLSWPLPDALDDATLEAMFYPPRKPIEKQYSPDPKYIHQEMQRKNVTLQLLWTEYKQQNPNGCQYSWYCEIYQNWLKKQNISLHQKYSAGEKLFVDWAGQTVPIIDPIICQLGSAEDRRAVYLYLR